MVDLAHKLGLEVVAEGWRPKSSCQQLREAHCDEAQGFLLGRPAPLATLRESGALAAPELIDRSGPGSVFSGPTR